MPTKKLHKKEPPLKPLSKNSITVCGNLGAGKSDVVKIIATILGLEPLHIGDLFKKESLKKGMTLDEFHRMMNTDPKTDLKIDKFQKAFLKKKTNYIIDSRLARKFAPKEFSVFLQVTPKIGATRIWKDLKNNPSRQAEMGVSSIKELIQWNERRVKSEKRRYKKLYNHDHTDLTQYDLVLRTDSLTQRQVANIIVYAFKIWRGNCRFS